jgi:cation:H+ antiporter
MLTALLQVGGGVALLYGGGYYLVRGATSLALLLRVSTTFIGLTVVAMGTSMPELAVSMEAAARGSTDISYSNVIGSNIFNVGAILGVAALMTPLLVQRQTVRIEYPFMVLAACLVLLFGRDGRIDRLEGLFFLVSLILFLIYIGQLARREVVEDEAIALEREVRRAAHFGNAGSAVWLNVGLLLVGAAALLWGADLVIRGAVTLARTWGVSERVVGLTIVAMGTSLPELATSIVAVRRHQQELALANIIGSNIFNMLAILGATSVIFPVPVHPRAAAVDNWVMLGFCVGLFPLMLWGRRVGRLDAAVLLTGFVAYMAWLFIAR